MMRLFVVEVVKFMLDNWKIMVNCWSLEWDLVMKGLLFVVCDVVGGMIFFGIVILLGCDLIGLRGMIFFLECCNDEESCDVVFMIVVMVVVDEKVLDC